MSAPDAGRESASGTSDREGQAPPDLVDDETKRMSQDEAAQHSDTAEAQLSSAEEAGGYGH